MRQLLLAITLVIALSAPWAAKAQDVGVPQDKNSSIGSTIFNFFSPHSAAPAAAPAATPAKPAAASQTTTPANPLPMTPAPSVKNAMAAMYMPPEEQQRFIQTEQDNIAHLQRALDQVSKSQTAFNQNPKTQQEKDSIAMMQQYMAQSQANLTTEIQAGQQRLQVLQAGPIRITDFGKLYH